MENKQQHIKQELQDLGIPLEHKPNMPLSVPEGYFDSFNKDLLAKVHSLDFMESLPKNMPQDVPDGYFEGQKKDILTTVTSIDFLDTLPKNEVQKIPDGYFEQMQKDVLDKIEETPTVQGGMLLKRSTQRKNWALAASMALIVSLGLFFMTSDDDTMSIEKQLALIPMEQVNEYISDHDYDFEAYEILENPQIITKDMQSLEEEILEEIKTMSNEEIFEYVL